MLKNFFTLHAQSTAYPNSIPANIELLQFFQASAHQTTRTALFEKQVANRLSTIHQQQQMVQEQKR
jgi:hypothetical protein